MFGKTETDGITGTITPSANGFRVRIEGETPDGKGYFILSYPVRTMDEAEKLTAARKCVKIIRK